MQPEIRVGALRAHWSICTQVESCAYESELRLLRAAAPRAPAEALVDASLLWRDLRGLVDEGRLSYPYSTRELVKVAKHLDAYPGDGLAAACADVFAFDGFDARLAALLATVLEGHGVDADEALGGGQGYGDMTLKLPEGFKTIKRPGAPAGMPSDGPKHGAWDDEAHMGGNMFAGGSGGSGTAGLGGRGGPYRLDVGQQLGHMTQQEKDAVDDASLAAAKDMATKAHAKKLEELGFGPAEASAYEAARDAVLLGATELRAALLDREKRDRERVWKTRQTVGELDDNLLVDGVAGERGVYRRRVAPDGADDDDDADRPAPTSKHGETRDPIRLRFVFDCSGSMYTFNRIDRRLERLQQIALFVFEALDGLDDDYDYSVVAHSGNGPEAELFVPWGAGGKPKSPKERWAVCQRMAAHAQYCSPGDHTRVPVSAILWSTIAVPF